MKTVQYQRITTAVEFCVRKSCSCNSLGIELLPAEAHCSDAFTIYQKKSHNHHSVDAVTCVLCHTQVLGCINLKASSLSEQLKEHTKNFIHPHMSTGTKQPGSSIIILYSLCDPPRHQELAVCDHGFSLGACTPARAVKILVLLVPNRLKCLAARLSQNSSCATCRSLQAAQALLQPAWHPERQAEHYCGLLGGKSEDILADLQWSMTVTMSTLLSGSQVTFPWTSIGLPPLEPHLFL